MMPGKKYYQMDAKKVLEDLNTGDDGLSDAEAKKRLQRYGKNELRAKIRVPLWLLFLSQFRELLILILILGGLVSYFIGNYRDGSIIFIIVFVNAMLCCACKWEYFFTVRFAQGAKFAKEVNLAFFASCMFKVNFDLCGYILKDTLPTCAFMLTRETNRSNPWMSGD